MRLLRRPRRSCDRANTDRVGAAVGVREVFGCQPRSQYQLPVDADGKRWIVRRSAAFASGRAGSSEGFSSLLGGDGALVSTQLLLDATENGRSPTQEKPTQDVSRSVLRGPVESTPEFRQRSVGGDINRMTIRSAFSFDPAIFLHTSAAGISMCMNKWSIKFCFPQTLGDGLCPRRHSSTTWPPEVSDA